MPAAHLGAVRLLPARIVDALAAEPRKPLQQRGIALSAQALGEPGRRAELQLELVGGSKGAVHGQQRVVGALVEIVDARVELGNAPAEPDRHGEVVVIAFVGHALQEQRGTRKIHRRQLTVANG